MSVPYCQLSDLQNLMDAVNLQASLDDYALGNSNTTYSSPLLNNIILMASNKCDALVASIYQTPFNQSNPPAKIKDACICFCMFAIAQRRLTPTEVNPYKGQQDYWIDVLTKVGAGQLPLDANFQREFTPVYIRTSRSPLNSNIF